MKTDRMAFIPKSLAIVLKYPVIPKLYGVAKGSVEFSHINLDGYVPEIFELTSLEYATTLELQIVNKPPSKHVTVPI